MFHPIWEKCDARYCPFLVLVIKYAWGIELEQLSPRGRSPEWSTAQSTKVHTTGILIRITTGFGRRDANPSKNRDKQKHVVISRDIYRDTDTFRIFTLQNTKPANLPYEYEHARAKSKQKKRSWTEVRRRGGRDQGIKGRVDEEQTGSLG